MGPAAGSAAAAGSAPALCGTSGVPEAHCTAALVAVLSTPKQGQRHRKHWPALIQSITRGNQAGDSPPLCQFGSLLLAWPPCTLLEIYDCGK